MRGLTLQNCLRFDLEVEGLGHQHAPGFERAWFQVMRRLRMNLLAGSVLLSKSGLTRLIDRMEAEGLVERCSCPGDRRDSYAVLTPRGEQVFTDAAPVHLEGIERHFTSHLSSSEAEALVSAFEKINAAQRAGAVQARSHTPG